MIDTSFDFRSDAGGKDPDSYSPTLRHYHRLLWSKPLPGGAVFDLDDTTRGAYLHHSSELGEFWLASDAVIATFTRWSRMQPIMEQMPSDEHEEFMRLSYTIGGMMLFPGNTIDGKQTINAARGFNASIADRIDLTLECIRRHYGNESSPLSPVLARYADFFRLFGDFRGYTDFFLLQDLVSVEALAVEFFMPFADFAPPAVPRDVDTYREYRKRSTEFINARNRRIGEQAS